MPLMGWGLGHDDDGQEDWYGLVAGTGVTRAEQQTADGYVFMLYFLRGSLNEQQEQELFNHASRLGQELEQSHITRNERPPVVGKSARRFTRPTGGS